MIARGARAAAARHAVAAVVPEGQPGRPAGRSSWRSARRPCRCSELDEYAETMHGAAALDGQRRRAGQRVRRAEVRRAHRARPARSSPRARSASTRSPRRSRTPTSNLPDRHAVRRRAQLHRPGQGQLMNAEDYRPIVVAYRNGSPVRLSEVGRRLRRRRERHAAPAGSTASRPSSSRLQRQPGTNTVEVVDAIGAAAAASRQQLPASLDLESAATAPSRSATRSTT